MKYQRMVYLSCWKDWKAETIRGDLIDRIILSFIDIKENKLSPGKNFCFYQLNKILFLKQKYPDLKIILAVGGWEGEGFSDAALTDASRKEFAQSVVDFLRANQLDGIDLDWEYPSHGEKAGILSRKEDKQNFTLLVKTLRQAFDAEKKASGKYYSLSFPCNVQDWYIQGVELEKLGEYVDFFNLMTYDFAGPWDLEAGHFAQFQDADYEGVKYEGITSGITKYLKRRIPPSKIILGFPFYGYCWEGVVCQGHKPLYQKSTGKRYALSYTEINARLNSSPAYKELWDDESETPYIWNDEKKEFICYENLRSIQNKIEYLVEIGLGGFMAWEYLEDDSCFLLQHINKILKTVSTKA